MEPNYKATMELYEQILLVIYMLVFKQTIASDTNWKLKRP